MDLEARGGGEPRGRAHLVDVFDTWAAELQVRLEALDVLVAEPAVEVVRDEFDDLLTGDAARDDLGHARYASRSLRTFARARCSRTRWLPSLTSSATLTSSGDQPSTSLSTITSC